MTNAVIADKNPLLPQQTPAPSQTGPATGGTRTGIDDKNKVVRIAIHGIPTGGSEASVRAGAEGYWQNGPGGRPRTLKNGYTVQPVFFDDGRAPASALRQCNAQARSSFLIYAAAGAEQIKACASSDVLRRTTVPYLSTGVTEAGLSSRPNYFATTPTYEQQAPLTVRAARDGGFFGGKWAIVTPGGDYAGVTSAMASALTNSKAAFDPDEDVFTVDRAPRDCSALGTAIRDGKYSTVYFVTDQPAFFAQCVGVIGSGPTFTGPGATLGYNAVANLACGAFPQVKAVYLHPVTGLDKASERAAGRSFASDVEYQVYAAMQTLEAALNLVEAPLTRERLLDRLRSGSLPDGIAPGAAYKRTPFGGKAAYAIKARCGGNSERNQFQTIKRYDR